MIKISHRYTGAILYEAAGARTIAEAVMAAIIGGADLRGADLRGADLREANLWRRLQINGSSHFCQWTTRAELAIGCKTYPIHVWLSAPRGSIGGPENYTADQVDEYRDYINIFGKCAARRVVPALIALASQEAV